MLNNSNPTDVSIYDGTHSHNDSFMSGFNKQIVNILTPLVPAWLQTYHLTSLTYVWSVLIIISGRLGIHNTIWYWGVVISIFGHYITDLLDGEVGRRRQTGLIRWGFYADHFGDNLFLASVIVSISFITPPYLYQWLILLLITWSAFFLNAYLILIIKRQFTLSFFRFSSIEAQFLLMILVALIAKYGRPVLPYILYSTDFLSILGLILVFFRTQTQLWEMDKHPQHM